MKVQTVIREMSWDGAVNTRDLAGLPGIVPGRIFRSARRETRQALLSALAAGDVEQYLLQQGVNKDEIGSIRRLLLDP